MTIRLKTVTNRRITLQRVRQWESVQGLKVLIQGKERIPAEQQILNFGHTILENERALADYGIDEKTMLQLSLLLGTFVCKNDIV